MKTLVGVGEPPEKADQGLIAQRAAMKHYVDTGHGLEGTKSKIRCLGCKLSWDKGE